MCVCTCVWVSILYCVCVCAHAQAGRRAGGSQDNCYKQAFASTPICSQTYTCFCLDPRGGDESTVAPKQERYTAKQHVGQQLVYPTALCAQVFIALVYSCWSPSGRSCESLKFLFSFFFFLFDAFNRGVRDCTPALPILNHCKLGEVCRYSSWYLEWTAYTLCVLTWQLLFL